MAKLIRCKVTDEYVQGAGVVIGAAGSHNDVLIELTFSEVWNDTTKQVVWHNALGQNPTIILLTLDMRTEEGSYLVSVPFEAKELEGDCSMTVKGAKTDGNVETFATLTTTAYFRVLPSAWDADAEESKDLTPSQAVLIQNQLDMIIPKIDRAMEGADAADEAEAARDAAALSAGNAYTYSSDAQRSAENAADSKAAALSAQRAAEKARDDAQAIVAGDISADLVRVTAETASIFGLESGASVDDALAVAGTSIPNPNLLDTWYFADPIDQRGGYVVKPNAPYFNLTDSTNAGTTDKYYKVDSISNDGYANAVFTIDGVKYYTTKSNYARGYVITKNYQYTFDRWWGYRVDGAILLSENGATIVLSPNGYTSLAQQMNVTLADLAGKQVTISAIVNGELVSATADIPESGGEDTVFVTQNAGEYSIKLRHTSIRGVFYEISVPVTATSSVTVLAVKAELGSVQTLAHQDADGNWVLNDPPPDKGMELLKCCMSTADSTDTYANNKVTPAAINAVNKAGDTMTGNITISTESYPTAYLRSRSLSRETRITKSSCTELQDLQDNNNYTSLALAPETTSEKNLLRLLTKTNGATTVERQVLHTGNLSSLGVAKIATGSYDGTGTYGADNPCTLTFEFVPKLVIIFSQTGDAGFGTSFNGDRAGAILAARPTTHMYGTGGLSTTEGSEIATGYGEVQHSFTWGDTSFSWYTHTNLAGRYMTAGAQKNNSGTTYYYIAIG